MKNIWYYVIFLTFLEHLENLKHVHKVIKNCFISSCIFQCTIAFIINHVLISNIEILIQEVKKY